MSLVDRPHCLFLDSAMRRPSVGRYSFLTADPFDVLASGGATSDLEELARRMTTFSSVASVDGLPPFQGGAAGLFGYELGRQLETIPPPRSDAFGLPDLLVGFYDVVVAWDHASDRCWIVSQGLPETEPAQRRRRAERRLAEFRRWLGRPSVQAARTDRAIDPIRLATHHPVDQGGLTSDFSEAGYLEAVRRIIDYIHAGDVFQVNLSQRLLLPAKDSSVELHQRLRRRNPAPFAGYFDLGRFQVVSASPERFLSVRDGVVQARPIKGTCPRVGQPTIDRPAGRALRASEKNRAENVMIVDLMRNDLSRVCRAPSVRVTQLCGLEEYAYVQHLVSVVEGRLREGLTSLDLIRAAFPGGSVTGAPKIRAMEIIAELEPTARGPYCGSLGYIGFDDTSDLSILIRTITAGAGWWQAPVGGGIVAESDPRREYEETWHKAEGLLRAM